MSLSSLLGQIEWDRKRVDHHRCRAAVLDPERSTRKVRFYRQCLNLAVYGREFNGQTVGLCGTHVEAPVIRLYKMAARGRSGGQPGRSRLAAAAPQKKKTTGQTTGQTAGQPTSNVPAKASATASSALPPEPPWKPTDCCGQLQIVSESYRLQEAELNRLRNRPPCPAAQVQPVEPRPLLPEEPQEPPSAPLSSNAELRAAARRVQSALERERVAEAAARDYEERRQGQAAAVVLEAEGKGPWPLAPAVLQTRRQALIDYARPLLPDPQFNAFRQTVNIAGISDDQASESRLRNRLRVWQDWDRLLQQVEPTWAENPNAAWWQSFLGQYRAAPSKDLPPVQDSPAGFRQQTTENRWWYNTDAIALRLYGITVLSILHQIRNTWLARHPAVMDAVASATPTMLERRERLPELVAVAQQYWELLLTVQREQTAAVARDVPSQIRVWQRVMLDFTIVMSDLLSAVQPGQPIGVPTPPAWAAGSMSPSAREYRQEVKRAKWWQQTTVAGLTQVLGVLTPLVARATAQSQAAASPVARPVV